MRRPRVTAARNALAEAERRIERLRVELERRDEALLEAAEQIAQLEARLSLRERYIAEAEANGRIEPMSFATGGAS